MANGPSATAAITPPPGYTLETPDSSVPQNEGITPPPGYTLESAEVPGAYQTKPGGPILNANPETQPDPTFGQNVGQGLGDASRDIWGTIKHAVTHPIDTAEGIAEGAVEQAPPVQLYKEIKEDIPAYHAYEQTRAAGGSVVDSLKAASVAKAKLNSSMQAVAQAVEAFKKNPTAATTRAITDAGAMALASWAGGEALDLAMPGEVAAETEGEAALAKEAALTPPKPGLFQRVKQAVSPNAATQPGAQAAVRSAAESAADDAGVTAANAPNAGIRTLLDKPIAEAAKVERGLYDTLNESAGTDMKDLYDYREKLLDALDDPTQIANHRALEQEMRTNDLAIKVHEDEALTKGVVSKDTFQQAKAATQQRYAMEEGAKKLFNNESVVKGNVAHGAEETLNVDALIKNAENLDKPSRFAPRGSPTRLQQMFGEDGAKAFKDRLYAAQKAGITVANHRTVLKWLGITLPAAAAAGYELLKSLE